MILPTKNFTRTPIDATSVPRVGCKNNF